METPEIYRTILLFFAVAGVAIPIFSRMKVSPVLGFLIIGALLGPYGMGKFEGSYPVLKWVTFHHTADNEAIAEFGVVFLMFTIGLELSWERLRALRRLVFGAGSLQLGLCAIALGLLAYASFDNIGSAAVIGLALALSSTAIGLPILAEQKRLASSEGRISFSVLLFQDLSVAPILFTVGLLNAPNSDNMLTSFLMVFGQAAIAIGIIVAFGRWPLRHLFRIVASLGSDDLFMASCLFVVVSSSLITAVFGLSMALGAFLGGLLLAETEYRRAVDAVIEPFKGLLLGLFFTTIGMKVNIATILESPFLIFGLALSLFIVKGTLITGISMLFGTTLRSGLKAGIILGSGSEFTFVIIGIAAHHLVSEHLASSLTMIVAISMMMLPILGHFLLPLLDEKQDTDSIAVGEEVEEALPDYSGERVIVVGYGYVGQLTSDMLTHHNIPHLIVDKNPVRVDAGRKKGVNIFFGDATKRALLDACGIDKAKALVITTSAAGLVETIATIARRMHPSLMIVSRARDTEQAAYLHKLGVNYALPEITEISLQLSEALLLDLGVPEGVVIASVHQRRNEVRSFILAQTEEEDYDTPPGEDERAA